MKIYLDLKKKKKCDQGKGLARFLLDFEDPLYRSLRIVEILQSHLKDCAHFPKPR